MSQLSLEMKKLALSISSLDFECKESQTKVVLEQKEAYIKLLEEQLKIRDSMLDSEYIKPSERASGAYMNLKTIEELAAQSMILNLNKNKDYARSLPPISHSRIPRPKAVSPTSSIKSKTREITNLPSLSKNDMKNKYKEGRRRRYAHKIRSYSTGSSDSDESSASTYVNSEKKAQKRPPIRQDRTNISPSFRRQAIYKN